MSMANNYATQSPAVESFCVCLLRYRILISSRTKQGAVLVLRLYAILWHVVSIDAKACIELVLKVLMPDSTKKYVACYGDKELPHSRSLRRARKKAS